ncbi:hypothetical protein HZB60_11345 [candidate division KSB1 bacterium]|nr:hypothetical protein [candidate division KSB1 bacterium]
MTRTLIALIFVLLSVGESPAAERQVAFDSEGKLRTISAELAQQLRMFRDVADFREARLYVEQDTLFTLELLSGPADSVERERRPLTALEVAQLRQEIDGRIQTSAPELYLDQTGRTKLLLNSTVLGIFGYGPVLPYILSIEDGAAATGLYLLAAGGSFFVPWAATERSNVTRASASLATYGLTRGALFTYQLASVFRGDQTEDRGVVGLTFAGGVAAGFGGFALGARRNMTDGRAGMIGTGGDFGDALGMGIGALTDRGEDDEEEWRKLAGWGLLGAAGGMVLENGLALKYPYTRGDSYVIRGAGYLGIGIPLAIMGTADVNDEDVLLTGGILGGVAGLVAGHVLVRGQSYTVAAGQQSIIAGLAGGLAGLGIGTIINSGRDDNAPLYLGTMLGAVGGYGIAVYQHRRIASLLGERVDFAAVEPTILTGSEGHAVIGVHVRILGN